MQYNSVYSMQYKYFQFTDGDFNKNNSLKLAEFVLSRGDRNIFKFKFCDTFLVDSMRLVARKLPNTADLYFVLI